MRPNAHSPIRDRRLSALLFCLTFLQTGHARADDSHSAGDILTRSNAAMTAPLKYRLITNGGEMVTYQKMLPDGSMASLSEMITPIKKILINRGAEHYEVYLDRKIAVDARAIYQGPTDQAAAISAKLGGKPSNASKIAGSVQHDGVDCHVIESTLATGVLEALAKAAPAAVANMIPAMTRQVIDKKTYLPVSNETLSSKGVSIGKTEFRDFTPQPELTDDFFLLPPGLEVKSPKSMKEYMDISLALLVPKLDGVVLGTRPSPRSMPPVQNEVVAPPMKLPDALVSATPVEPTLTSQEQGPGPLRRITILVLVLAPLILGAVVISRRAKYS